LAKATESDPGPLDGPDAIERCYQWARLVALPGLGADPAGTLELRALRVSRSGSRETHAEMTRYPATEDGLRRLAREAVRISPRAEGCYINLNPLRPGLDRNATDADVVRRVWLPIDLDPFREGTVSSTWEEKQAASLFASHIKRELEIVGWPMPLFADSGNGYHLLYRIDLPADDGGLVERCLKALRATYQSEAVKIDTGIFNPSRIWKLYGTLARKGEDTEERPHRLAQVLTGPEEPEVVPVSLLEELAARAPAPGPAPAPAPKEAGEPARPRKRRGLIARSIDPDDKDERALAYLAECEPAVSGSGGHNTTLRVMCSLGPGFDLTEEECFDLAWKHYNPRCQPAWSEKDLRRKVAEAYKREERRGWLLEEEPATNAGTTPGEARGEEGKKEKKRGPGRPRKNPEVPAILDEITGNLEGHDDPHRIARIYLRERYDHPERPTILYHDEQFHTWDGRCWDARKDKEIGAEATAVAKREIDEASRQAGLPSKAVGTRLVGNILQAIRGEVLVRIADVPTLPAWLGARGEDDREPVDYLAASNGLVHLPTLVGEGDHAAGVIRPPTPRYFSPSALRYPFRPGAPAPGRWLGFLGQLWPDDPDAILCLQEWFGYLLTLDTSFQKILLLIGPKRSGKGTITRVLVRLIGEKNHSAPTLASLATPFGRAGLIGKQLAVVTEARISGRADGQAIVETLLSISGEDPQSIDRKFLTHWEGKLLCRFVLLGNSLPRLGDASGALVSRFVVLRLQRSFLGEEDLGLTEKLLPELPGILLWAIEGLKRLRAQGRFTIPASSKELTDEFERLANPIGAFLAECCELGDPAFRVKPGDLFEAWRSWCKDQGRDHTGDQASFGKDLFAAVPRLSKTNPRDGEGKRVWFYLGIRIRGCDPDAPF
jgi:putative DNA primase/helicase